MNIPNSDGAEVSKEKVTDYLLNPLHPDGASKAVFFAAMGFSAEDWSVLADALKQIVASCPVVNTSNSPHGDKYIVDGRLTTPGGKTPMIRTVWIMDTGAEHPRLVTAYPQDKDD